MIWVLLLSFASSVLLTLLMIALSHRHARWSMDHDLDGPQKMHEHAVPRVGGIGIAVGLAVGALVLGFSRMVDPRHVALLLLACIPAFAFGLIEDVTKSVSPRRRLVATAVSGALGIYLLGASFGAMNWGPFAAIAAMPLLAWPITLLYCAGMANAVNIIDGMNGLASMCMAIMMVALAYIAFQVDDRLVGGMALASVGAALGFFIWNYPRGLIFLGDGGAYLFGFLLAELTLLLCARNPSVSPLLVAVLPAYPIFETLFTMYRRRVIRGRPVSLPDGIHLHTLIYRRLMRWAVGRHDLGARTKGNSMTSPYLWALSTVTVVPATVFWDSSLLLALTLLGFTAVYLTVYWRIVRFRTPSWLMPPPSKY